MISPPIGDEITGLWELLLEGTFDFVGGLARLGGEFRGRRSPALNGVGRADHPERETRYGRRLRRPPTHVE
nr:hypothetical protein GCM10020093_001630 [Planobispora longispora]